MESGNTPVQGAERSDILKQLSRCPPRNGGFSRFSALENWAEFSDERNLRRIRQYLLESDPAPIEDTSSKPIASKHFLKGFFRSHSDRRHSKQSKKMLKMQSPKEERKLPVVAQRTSYGEKNGQIITNQVYDVNRNASTYQINTTRGASGASTGKEIRKSTEPAKDNVSSTAVSSFRKVTGLRRPADSAPVQQANGYNTLANTPSPYQTAGFREPTSERLVTKLVNDRHPNENVPPGPSMSQIPKPLIDVPLQPVHHANDSFFVSRKEYPHLLLGDDKQSSTPRASKSSIPKTESQLTIRDFAPNGPAQVQRAKVTRLRSRSPIKRVGKQKSAASSIVDIPAFPKYNGQVLNSEVSIFQNTDPISSDPNARSQAPPPTQPLRRPVPSLQPSPIAGSPPKASSIVSAESTAEDIRSNTASIVVSNAQIATMIRNQSATTTNHRTSTPSQPGPVPTKALPALPKGQAPMTPTRLSESSQRMPTSPERTSPMSLTKLPLRSPARYRFTPMDLGTPSPPKRVEEPIRINAASDPEAFKTKPAKEPEEIKIPHSSPGQEKGKRPCATFPKPKDLPKSLSAGELDHRTERTKAMKVRDLARMKSQKAEIEDIDAAAIKAGGEVANGNEDEEGSVRHEGLVLLPSPPDFTNFGRTSTINPIHPHFSQLSSLSTSTTLQGGSSTLSQRLSPIVVLAEQEPISSVSVQRASSQKSHFRLPARLHF